MRLGIDVGGTKTHAVLIDERGVIRDEIHLPTGFGPDDVLTTAVAVAQELAERAAMKVADMDSVGVGIPGTVDPASGRVSHAVNLGVNGLDLGQELTARLGADVHVENDVNGAAIGAYHLLGAGVASMAYLNLGTGLAAGLVLNGNLWRGSGGIAGEIGHIPIDPNGERCPCGQRGCLETVASGSGLARRWATDGPQPVRALFAAAESGDLHAQRVRNEFVEGVAAAVRILVLTAGVDVVVMGGGISSLGESLRRAVSAVLDEWARESEFLASVALSERLRIVPDRSVAAAVGAALIPML